MDLQAAEKVLREQTLPMLRATGGGGHAEALETFLGQPKHYSIRPEAPQVGAFGKKKHYTIAVDFDGVIHRYDTKWINAHTIPDPPVVGAIEWLGRLVQTLDVVIYSTRCRTWRGRRAIRAWLKKYSGTIWNESVGAVGIEQVKLSFEKPAALVYIDDRAWRFDGSFPTAEELLKARPWNKK